MTVIAQPGVYDLPAADYHRDPVKGGSLSSSGARKLLPPSCPALFHHWRHNPQPANPVFDFGHAAHKQVLGVGPKIWVVDADDWRSKAAREQRDQAYADGCVPLLAADFQRVEDMAAALLAHPFAAALFRAEAGKAEQTLVWQDQQAGVWCRAMLDFLPDRRPTRMVVPDYKTAQSAAPAVFGRCLHTYGYAQQAAWYLDGVRALGLADDPQFLFVVQEKTPPYLVSVVQPDSESLLLGQRRNRQALQTYAGCAATGVWPGYSSDVEMVSLPPYAIREYEETLT